MTTECFWIENGADSCKPSHWTLYHIPQSPQSPEFIPIARIITMVFGGSKLLHLGTAPTPSTTLIPLAKAPNTASVYPSKLRFDIVHKGAFVAPKRRNAVDTWRDITTAFTDANADTFPILFEKLGSHTVGTTRVHLREHWKSSFMIMGSHCDKKFRA